MAKPTLTARNLRIGNAQERGGRWILDYGTMVTIALIGDSSGNSTPFIRFHIDWGDGTMDVNEALPIGREFVMYHQYAEAGEYVIIASAINSDGERSAPDPQQTALLRLMEQSSKQKQLYKWIGLALPVNSIGQALALVEDVYPVQTHRLAESVSAGVLRLVLYGVADQTFLSDSEITIWEDGKLITSGRITSQEFNVVLIDTATASAYTEAATVEIRQRAATRGYSTMPTPDSGWAFPKSIDEDLVRASIAFLLSTRPMERLHRPKVGSRLPELAFEQNDMVTQQLAFRYTADVLSAFEPRVALRTVIYEAEGDEARIRLTYSFRDARSEIFEASVPLAKLNPTAPF